jgi:hypothetical protein
MGWPSDGDAADPRGMVALGRWIGEDLEAAPGGVRASGRPGSTWRKRRIGFAGLDAEGLMRRISCGASHAEGLLQHRASCKGRRRISGSKVIYSRMGCLARGERQ